MFLNNPPTWTEARVELAKKLFEDGATAGQAAARIGGVSRNAIIGKWNRMGLRRGFVRPKRTEPVVRRANRQREELHAAKRRVVLPPMPVEPLPPPAVTDIARVALTDLERHHCRWPVGEPTQGFCGCKPYPGLVYCEPHARRAYRPVEAKRAINPIPKPKPNRIAALGVTMFKNASELLDA